MNRCRRRSLVDCLMIAASMMAVLGAAPAARAETPAPEPAYEIGGPLAGLKLPPYPTYHGEPAGQPGNSFGPPQLELYPGSVEHWRAYWFKYCPVRSMFDRQSQRRNWTAPAIPGAPKTVETYAQPVWTVRPHGDHEATGAFEPPVDVVRVQAGDTILSADLGELPQGVYCLRLVAAAPPEFCTTNFRSNLFAVLTVNDRLDGGDSTYRVRIGYCDQFYSVAELYFHAVEKRAFRASLSLDPASEIPLLVRNVSLDDALAGVQRGAHKRKANVPLPAEWLQHIRDAEAKRAADPAAVASRLERDARLWNAYPHPNRRFVHLLNSTEYGMRGRAPHTVPGMTEAELAAQYGEWKIPTLEFPRGKHADVFLRNDKLDLNYTFADLVAGRPLPDPFPFKDDGNGLVRANPDGKTGTAWTPIATAVQEWVRHTQTRAASGFRVFPPNPGLRNAAADADQLRDGLIALLRFSYDLPTYDQFQDLGGIVCHKGGFERSLYNRQRETAAHYYTWYTEYINFAELYDQYYEFIKGSQSLADSLNRFVPWIKTPEDIIDLCDSYLVQVTARRVLRYHTSIYPEAALRLAALLGDPKVTQPWMEWTFSRTFVYPLTLMGMQHMMASAYDHSGIEFGRSTYYGMGENAANLVEATEKYCQATGDRSFSMNDPVRYAKGRAALYWPLAMFCSGWQAPRIGDVAGPDKAPDAFLSNSPGMMRRGWEYTGDPRFAAILVHMGWAKGYVGKELEALQAAAATVTRMPWFDNQSRSIPNWAGVLEGGTQHNDIRFRRSAMVRTGWGSGHHHHDALDLQVYAFGLPMLIDSGQRPGYTAPDSRFSVVHNAVTVAPEGQEMRQNHVNGWVRGMAHTPELAYLQAQAGEPVNLDRGARQVALISVDEGRNAQVLSVDQQKPGVKLDPDVTLPKSYVFDVVRTAGAGTHRYNFHAMVNDEFVWNATEEKQDPSAFDGDFSASLAQSFKGKAPATFQATWRQRREADEKGNWGTESHMLGVNFDPAAPRKYVRLHLLGLEDAVAHRGELVTQNPPCPTAYHFTCIGVDQKATAGGSCFVALVEPYAGESFLKSATLLSVPGNSGDALKAVAVEVETTTGNRDLLLADGKPDVTRKLAAPAVQFAGEFAWQSVDDKGLRAAVLTGGTLLETPQVRIRAIARERVATIVRVDYGTKQVEVEGEWPSQTQPTVAEVGPAGRKVAVNVLSVEPLDGGHSLLNVAEGAQRLLTKATVDEEKRMVTPVARPLPEPQGSELKDWTVSNGGLTKVWKANIEGGFVLDGPVQAEDFGPERDMCLWDYGVGDTVRAPNQVTVRRLEAGRYEVRASVDATMALAGNGGTRIAADGTEAPLEAENGWVTVDVKASDAIEVKLR